MSTLLVEGVAEDDGRGDVCTVGEEAGTPRPLKRPDRLWKLGAADIVRICLWVGLAVSTWDVGLLAVRKFAWSQFLFANNDVFWTTTVTHVVTFQLVGVPLVFSAWSNGSFATVRPVAFVLVFAAAWSLLAPLPGLMAAAEVILAVGIATQLSRWIERRGDGFLRLVNCTWPVLAAGHLFVAVAIVGGNWLSERNGLAALPPAPADAPNVLLIVLDTVAYDALDLGWPNERGLPQSSTPNLKRFAESGVNFRHAISPAPWTLPAHASMFTGRHVHEHHATWHRPPDDRFSTLAERLRSAGYLTGGFVGNNIYCSRETGLARGFLHYADYQLDLTRFLQSTPFGTFILETVKRGRIDRVERKSADDVTGPFFDWLDGHAAGSPNGRPFFAFLNYFDAHDPYVAPPDYARHVPQEGADRTAIRDWWHIDKLTLTDQQVALGLYGYLDCINYLDDHLGRLLDALRQRGLLDSTIVIVTADHGEHFGDHQLFGHGNSLYQALVHVPLIVSCPGRVPRETAVDQFVGLVDLPATVLELTGRAADLPGCSLSRFWKPEESPAAEPVIAELAGPSAFPPNHGASPIFSGPMRAVISGNLKYIRAGDEEELFDLAADPREEHNRAGSPEHRTELGALRELAERAPD